MTLPGPWQQFRQGRPWEGIGMLHPLTPVELAVMAADGRPGTTLAEVVNLAEAIREAMEEHAIIAYYAERDAKVREMLEDDRSFYEPEPAA